MSKPKPKHLRAEYGVQFSDQSVVDAYRFRPSYPDEVFDVLGDLVSTSEPAVLDLGCGPGELARGLARRGMLVDAVDPSQPMIEFAQSLPAHEDVRWVVSSAEAFDFPREYDLVVTAESLHWMEWDEVLPAIEQSLAPGGWLAIVGRHFDSVPWWKDVKALIRQLSTNQDYEPYDLIEELENRQLFSVAGRRLTAPVPRKQRVEEQIEFWHSRNGLSRERMSQAHQQEFDAGVRKAVEPYAVDGMLEMKLRAELVWGRPRGTT